MITIIIQEHVLWFEISVDDSLLVEVLQALDDLSDIKTGSGLVKPRVVLIHQVDVVPSGNREQVSSGVIGMSAYFCSITHTHSVHLLYHVHFAYDSAVVVISLSF